MDTHSHQERDTSTDPAEPQPEHLNRRTWTSLILFAAFITSTTGCMVTLLGRLFGQ